MKKTFVGFLFFFTWHSLAECPVLTGTFHCVAKAGKLPDGQPMSREEVARNWPPFDLSITQDVQNGIAVYNFTDPTGTKTFWTDGQLHETEIRNGKGSYRAQCDRESVTMQVRGADGYSVADRYYIQRAAVVRLRNGAGSPTLSCAPTNGTWRRYQR